MKSVQYGAVYEVIKENKVEPVGFETHAKLNISSHMKNKKK
jgi:hypothetical protein